MDNSENELWKTEEINCEKDENDNTIMITQYCGKDERVIIPEIINGKKVTKLSVKVFKTLNIISVYIPSTINALGVFNDCINIPSFTFFHCPLLQEINVSEDNKNYASDNGILYDKSKETILLVPESCKGIFHTPVFVKKIGDAAFYNCRNINSIEISKGIIDIGNSAFLGCENLKSIKVEEENKYYSSLNSVLYNKDKDILLKVPMKEKGKVRVLETVKEIGNEAFLECKNIYEVEISSNVEIIGKEAFNDCTELKSIKVSEDNTVYSSMNGILYNKGKTVLIRSPQNIGGKFEVEKGVKKISYNAFYSCTKIEEIEFPLSVEEIEDEAFVGCESLSIMKIPSSVKKIGEWAFLACDNLEIRCKENSYVEQYAKENSIPYAYY